MEKPFVTIGIPCLNEEQYIEECIRCVYEQDYPHDHVEVIVADGGSSDRTHELLDMLAERHPSLRWIKNPGRIQAAAMNEIIKQAKGDVVVRLDAHTEYQRDYVSKCIEVLGRTGADNVGGAQRNRAKTWYQRAFCAAMSSPLGMGGASHRSAVAEGFVDTVSFGAFRRSVFETIGMFDAGAITNEDADINQRIVEAGGKVFLSPEIVFHYFPRDSPMGLARQYFKYGQGRARTFLKHGRLTSLRPMAPFAAVVGGTALLLTSAIQPFTLPAAGFYALATGIEAVRVGRHDGFMNIPAVWSVFPILHGCHGVGFAAGLVQYLRKPDWNEPETIAPRSEEQREDQLRHFASFAEPDGESKAESGSTPAAESDGNSGAASDGNSGAASDGKSGAASHNKSAAEPSRASAASSADKALDDELAKA